MEPSQPGEAGERRSRLMITKMVMENFKSYQGTQIVGPFHKCFSAVVGPNGSGKSNVIDALLFVFGFRAKKIRQSKIKDLIHKSTGHTDIESCQVTIHMQEIIDTGDADEEYEVVPGSEVSVTRKATNKSVSTYYLNGKPSQFAAVADALRLKGIDLDHNRFLILQGEVEQIAMMKPKAQTDHDTGLLEYLEDIIGSSSYKTKIAEQEKALEDVTETLNEKSARVRVAEEEMKSLEQGKREAEEYLRKQNQRTVCEAKRCQHYLAKLETNVSELTEKTEAARDEHKSLKTTLATAKKEASGITKAYEKEMAEFHELNTALEVARKDLASCERKTIKLQGELKQAQKNLKKAEAKIGKCTSSINEAEAALGNHESDIEREKAEVQALERKLAKAEAELEELQKQFQPERDAIQKQLEEKRNALMPLSKKRDTARNALGLKQAELDLLTKSERGAEEKLALAKEDLTASNTTIKEKKQELKEVSAEVQTLTASITAGEKELASITADLAPLDAKVKERRILLQENQNKKETSAQSVVVEKLREAQERGLISGFHGRLGDLGTIDEAYNCAITTACSALNSLVVDTVEEGQRCISFLRERKIGRATFILLDKIREHTHRADQAFSAPSADSQRLFDLVRMRDAKYRGAFYFALGDTLVCDSLDVATRIGYKNGKPIRRVVTTEGQLIEKSGTMSGGGKKALTGGMASQHVQVLSASEVAKVQSKLERDLGQLKTFRDRTSELEEQLTEWKKRHALLQAKEKRLAADIDGITNKMAALKDQVESLSAVVAEQRKRQGDGDEQKQALEEEIASLTAAYDKTARNAEKVEAVIKGLEADLANVGSADMKLLRAQVQLFGEQIASGNQAITKRKVDLKTDTRKVTQAQKQQAEAEKEVKALNKQIVKAEAQLAELEEHAKTVQVQEKEAYDTLTDREDAIQDIKKRNEEVQAQLATLNADVVDSGHALELLEGDLKENKDKAGKWKRKLKSLVLHVIEEDEEDEDDADKEGGNGNGDGDGDELGSDMEDGEDGNDGENKTKRAKTKPSKQIPVLDREVALAVDVDELEVEINVLDEQIKGMKPNQSAIEAYKKKKTEYLLRVCELNEIIAQRDAVRRTYEGLRTERLTMFSEGFSIISNKLKEMYRMITLGGDAELEFADKLDPFTDGIYFSVRPPKKSWKKIENLSGGEKTLSSLSLVFALHHYKPTPLYVMDEIDAALDFKNVSIIANYIKERTKNAQFIIISLRNNMFELADRLVGIYKTHDCTKSVTINPALVAARALEKGVRQTMPSAQAKRTLEESQVSPPAPLSL